MIEEKQIWESYNREKTEAADSYIGQYMKYMIPAIYIAVFSITFLAGMSSDQSSSNTFATYFLFTLAVTYAIHKRLLCQFGGYNGVVLYTSVILSKIWLDIHVNQRGSPSIYPKCITQLYSLLAKILIRDYKKEVVMCLFEKFCVVGFRLYLSDKVDLNELVDEACCIFLFAHMSYMLEKTNFTIFKSITEKLKGSIDKVTEEMCHTLDNFCILKIEAHNKLSIHQCSRLFRDNFSQYSNVSDEDTRIRKMFKNFKYLPKEGLNQIQKMNLLNNNSINLIDYLDEFFHKQKSNTNSALGNKDTKNLYVIKSSTGSLESYDIKYTQYTQDDILEKKQFLMIHFSLVTKQIYISNNSENPEFENILMSSLAHELKNPLNGLNGQMFVIAKENSENIELHEKINKFLEDKQSPIENFNLLEDDELGINSLQDPKEEEFAKNALIKYMKSDLTLKTHLLFCKFLKKKLILITENFEIYSKLKLDNFFNIKSQEINLLHILSKPLRFLRPILHLNNNQLDCDIEQTRFCSIRTDINILKIIMNNIVMIMEKQSKNTQIRISVNLSSKSVSNPKVSSASSQKQTAHIKFKVYDVMANSDINLDNRSISHTEHISINNILSANNKRLARMIGCEYSEIYKEYEKYMRFEVVINDCWYNDKLPKGSRLSSLDFSLLRPSSLLLKDHEATPKTRYASQRDVSSISTLR